MSSNWPFIIIRHTGAINNFPDVFKEILDLSAKHPGACDEIWFASGLSYPTKDALRKKIKQMLPVREHCDKLNIMPSYQQGVTIGHGQEERFKNPLPDTFTFTDDDWQRSKTGKIMYGHLCPRSANAQQQHRDYARAILEDLKPASYWLDDDLRLGISKDDGCFCDRCIDAFNKDNETTFTRDELVQRLYGSAPVDDIREKWVQFNARSIALLAQQLQIVAQELNSDCRLAYQAVWANTFYTADSYRPLLDALSGPARKPVGIRPGAGFYVEESPRGMLHKSLNIAREAARCRRYGNIGQICYEQETYPRRILHKSPEAIMIESALMLASGCDSLSLYWYCASNPEPLERVDHFFKTTAEARPYFQFLGNQARTARLAGIARYLGQHAFAHKSFTLDDDADEILATYAVPVTVQEAEPDAFFLTKKSVECLDEDDLPKLFAKPLVIPADVFDMLYKAFPTQLQTFLPKADDALTTLQQAVDATALAFMDVDGNVTLRPHQRYGTIPAERFNAGALVMESTGQAKVAIVQSIMKYPTDPQRTMLLDAVDAAANGAFPARLDTCHAARLLPHVGADGRTASATILNFSIGETPELTLRLRHPAGYTAMLLQMRQESIPLQAVYDDQRDELVVTIPPVRAWQPVTIVAK